MYTQVWDAINNKVHETIILRDADQAYIPFDEGNHDYQKYKVWLAEGNEPKSPVDVPSPPVNMPPPPDINVLNYQVQDIDQRLCAIEARVNK